MSGHRPWREVQEERERALTPEQRAAARVAYRRSAEELRQELWRAETARKYVDALAAAAAGETVTWQAWPTSRELLEQASVELGTWVLDR